MAAIRYDKHEFASNTKNPIEFEHCGHPVGKVLDYVRVNYCIERYY